MPNKKTIFIIAGEVSGDVLGANIMRELRGVNFVGIGGQNMCGAGLKSIFPILPKGTASPICTRVALW